jgi:hypothetical protein
VSTRTGVDLQATGIMGFSADNSGTGAGPSGPAERPTAQGPQASDAKEVGYQELLDRVLQQTLLTDKSESPQRLESLDELLALARRRRGEAFQLDPIGLELVQTVLGTAFQALVDSDDQWRAMTRQVAETLCEDPESYDRLSSLWRRLHERCQHEN